MEDLLPDHLAEFIAQHRIEVSVVGSGTAVVTAEAAALRLGVPVSSIVKTMVLTDGTRFVAAILAGDRRLDPRKVASALDTGSLRFATASDVVEQTGFPAGGVAPLGFARPLAVVIDTSLTPGPDGDVIAGGGRQDLLIRISLADLIHHNDARVAPICRQS